MASEAVERIGAGLPELRRLPEEYAAIVRLVPPEAADRVLDRMKRGGPLTWAEVLECLNGAAVGGGEGWR